MATIGPDTSTTVPTATSTPAAAAAATSTVTALRPRAFVRVRLGKSRTKVRLAKDNALRPVVRGKTTVVVKRSSRRVCKVGPTSVRALRLGICRYTVTTYSASGKRTGKASWAFVVIPRGASVAAR